MDMKKTYISASFSVIRLTKSNIVTSSVTTYGLVDFYDYGGIITGRSADAAGLRSVWE